jgi:hypothetical protein
MALGILIPFELPMEMIFTFMRYSFPKCNHNGKTITAWLPAKPLQDAYINVPVERHIYDKSISSMIAAANKGNMISWWPVRP